MVHDTTNKTIQLWIIICIISGAVVCGICILSYLVDIALYYYRNPNNLDVDKDATYRKRLMTDPEVVIPFQHIEDEV
jgi:hypothetical protein